MNKNEKALAAAMLEDLSDILGRRTCNDFEFPPEWPVEEIKAFVKSYYEWNGDPENYNENDIVLPDFAVASMLADRLKASAKTDEVLEQIVRDTE